MGAFKEMNPEDVWRAIEGYSDVVTPALRTQDTTLKYTPCPVCEQTNTQAFVNPSNPFSPGAIAPNKLLRCLGCECEFDPITRLILKAPTPELD